jgi:hypothetical protein
MLTLVMTAVLAQCDFEREVVARLGRPLASEVRVRREGGLIQIGVSGRSRTVAATDSCSDDAEVAAVIAATWLKNPVPPPPPPAAPVRVLKVPVPVLRPVVHEVPPSPPPPRPPETVPPLREPLRAADEQPYEPLEAIALARPGEPRARAGASIFVQGEVALGAGAAPGISLGVEAGGRLGAHAAITLSGERSTSLAGGYVRWWRTSLELGPRLHFDRGEWFFQPALTVVGGLISARGTGFDADSGGLAIAAGACTTLRAGRRITSGLVAFVSASGCAWPFTPALSVAGGGTVRPPTVEGTLGAGLAWDFR